MRLSTIPTAANLRRLNGQADAMADPELSPAVIICSNCRFGRPVPSMARRRATARKICHRPTTSKASSPCPLTSTATRRPRLPAMAACLLCSTPSPAPLLLRLPSAPPEPVLHGQVTIGGLVNHHPDRYLEQLLHGS
ncbi:hypothetical protein ACQJBY_036237 [Aegilops geniculata]